MKTAVVYFYNAETCNFIGPLYDSGPRFKKKDCEKRYSIYGRKAIINNLGEISTFIKETNSQ